jgi:hypothetical protein
MQQVGETSDAIIEDDNKEVERILSENKSRQDPYWIVMFVKPAKVTVDGRPALMKYLKAVYTKPRPQVGMIIGCVDNKSGTIKWEVNMPDKPFGYEALGLGSDGLVAQETSIPQSYRYNL